MTATCGDYEILRTLGYGGNAVVKLVQKQGTEYAMKIFEPHATEREEIITKTKEEMAVVQNLKIAAIPQYFEFNEDAVWKKKNGETKNVSYLVMENCQGVELIEFLNQCKRQDDVFVRYIFIRIAQALHQLHIAGIAHRDIKPENIILTDNFDIKLIDLGYGVSLSGRETDGFNRTTLGTPMYMAPEIVNKQPYQGADVDLFAFGVTLMVARLVAYPFNQACMTDEKYKLLAGENSSLFWKGYKKLGVSDDFIHLITSMLQHSPAARPTMADVLGHPWMRGEVITPEQFSDHCAAFMEKAKADRDAEQDTTGIDYSIPASAGKANRRGGDEDVMVFDTDFYMSHSFKEPVQQRLGTKSTQFLVNAKALDIMSGLYELAKDEVGKDEKVIVSNKSFKLKFDAKLWSSQEDPIIIDNSDPLEETKEEPVAQTFEKVVLATAQVAVELHEIEEGSKYLVSCTRKAGSNIAFMKTYDALHNKFVDDTEGEDDK